MSRRTLVLVGATLAVLAALAVGLLGVASGEGPAGSTATRTVSVEGVGVVPIGTADTAAQATAVYREAMAKALADGQAKAAFLSERAGVALGAVTSLVEDGGSIECTSADGREYEGYEGEQPDFGYGRTPSLAAAPLAAGTVGKSAPSVSHRPKIRPKHPTAHRASAARCNLTASVAAIYAIG